VLILAFDTSGFSGSVAVLDGPQLVAERTLDAARRSAQTLAPAIAELLVSQKIDPSRIGLVATTIGPGSFTGLRVGVTTAKTFAYAVGAQVLGISTLEAIAQRAPAELLGSQPRDIHAILDAQRQELFVGRFRSTGRGDLSRVEPDRILASDAWLASLSPGTMVTGSGVNRLEDRLPAGVDAVPALLRDASAAVVGRLAWRDFNSGRRDDLWRLTPVYLRPSYAEEKIAGTKPGPGTRT
jgi:tRNA threonylcarbamoyladenosine biosynthesis protein TsaB